MVYKSGFMVSCKPMGTGHINMQDHNSFIQSFIHSFYLSDISDANLAGLLSSLRLKLSGLPVISNVMLTERSCSNLQYVSPKDTPSTTSEQEKSDRLHIYNTCNYLAKSNIHKKRQGLSKGSPKSTFLLFPVFPIFIYLLI